MKWAIVILCMLFTSPSLAQVTWRTGDPLPVQALSSLAPGKLWALSDSGDITTLQWLDVATQPTISALQAEMTRLAALPLLPQTVISALQLKVALVRAGKLLAVVQFVNAQSAEVQQRWSNARVFTRRSPLLALLVTNAVLTQDDVNTAFITAATIADDP